MNAAFTILALLLAAPMSGHPSAVNGGRPPGGGLDFSEFAIDTGVALLRVAQSRPSVAFDGAGYLVVSQDVRGGVASDIYGARVTPSGELLDGVGIAISMAAGAQNWPSVAFLDSVFLVVWEDLRNQSSSSDIYGARITRSGRVLDPTGIVICNAPGAQGVPVVTAGDTCWFVAWQDNRTEWDVRGTCVSSSGVVQNPGGVAVGAATGQQLYPAVAFNHVNFLVVWQSNQFGPLTLWGTRLTQAGQVLDPGGFFIAGDISQNQEPTAPSVAASGRDFLVAWQNARTPKYVYAKRVSGDGVPIEPTIPLPEADLPQQNPSVCGLGDGYLVAWEEQRGSIWGICGARVSSTGMLLDTTAVPVAVGLRDKYDVTTADGDGQCFAAWTDKEFDPNVPVVYGRVLDTAGIPAGTTFRAGSSAPFYCGQIMPALAASADGYVAAWEAGASVRSPGSVDYNTCCARLDADGRMLDSVPIVLRGVTYDSVPPAVACGDSSWIVARGGAPGMGVCAARIGFDGTILDPGWISLSSAGVTPAVAFDGENYLVTWSEHYNIYGSRVTQSGHVLDRVSIATTDTYVTYPAVAFDGTNYLVVWQKTYVLYQDDIWGARVTPEGTVLDPYGILIGPGQHMQEGPSLAFGIDNYLVAWHSRYDWRIYGRLVSRAGLVVGPESIRVSHWEGYYGDDWYPSVAFDGANYLVTWLEHNYSDATEYDINGSTVNLQGLVTDTTRLSRSGCPEQGPASAVGSDGRVLVLYQSVRDPNGGGRDTLPRIWGSFVSSGMGLAEAPRETRVRAALSINPNPFTRAVRFQLGPGCALPDAHLTIRDAAGRCVRTLACAQNCVLNWDGTDAAGRRLPAGIYFCTLKSGGTIARQKLAKLE